MSQKRPFSPEQSPQALGPYNHGVQIGNLLYTAGQIPIDPANGQLVGDDIEAQTQRVLDNIAIILEYVSLSFENVVKTTIFLTDLADFQAVNEIYGERFTAHYPARSTIQVAALPMGAKIEIEIVAHY